MSAAFAYILVTLLSASTPEMVVESVSRQRPSLIARVRRWKFTGTLPSTGRREAAIKT